MLPAVREKYKRDRKGTSKFARTPLTEFLVSLPLQGKEDYLLLSEIYGTLYTNERSIFYYEDILEQYKHHEKWQCLNSSVRQKKIIYSGENLN